MHKRNLTREKIIQVAISLADEIGLNQITFTKLAEKLGIKYPSLYNHFTNMEELKIEMMKFLYLKLNEKLIKGLVGKSGEAAIQEFAYSYRDFAFENRAVYGLFMSIPGSEDTEINFLAKETNNIICKIMEIYCEDQILVIHKSREFRSLLHGFVSMCFLGHFHIDVKLEDTFRFMVDDFITTLMKNNTIT